MDREQEEIKAEIESLEMVLADVNSSGEMDWSMNEFVLGKIYQLELKLYTFKNRN